MLGIRTLEQLRPVLLCPEGDGPEEVYYMIRGNPNITVMNPGKIGNEYVKTLGHYHKHNEPERYKILFGTALFLLQKKKEGKKDSIEDIKIVKGEQGATINIEEGYGHTMINIGNTPLVTTDNAPSNASEAINDYEPIKSMQGFAYYVVEDNTGKMNLIKNKNYRLVPNAKL